MISGGSGYLCGHYFACVNSPFRLGLNATQLCPMWLPNLCSVGICWLALPQNDQRDERVHATVHWFLSQSARGYTLGFLAMPSACVAAPITHLISVEMIKGLVSTFRVWTNVAVMRIETVINVALEVVRTVEPRTGSEEHPTAEPLGPVGPVWGAVVWGGIVVPIRAIRCCSDIDGDLCMCRARNAQQNHN